ncbi:MAG: alpha/beta fold hydrolase [Xanthomonadales bacterium]|nr:alpha/beta fold hydrolase [Xanthomonadales bacterium]
MTNRESSVLMIHGAGGGGWEWNVWRRVFEAAGYQVYAPDLEPAAGGLTATTFNHYREQLSRTVQGEAEPVLVGASLGGLLALSLANEVSARALVLLNPVPPSPLHERLLTRDPYPPIIPWGCDASIASTRRAMPDADDAARLYAFRRWRDESGAVLNAARAGIAVAQPACPVQIQVSLADTDVPAEVSLVLGTILDANLVRLHETSHVGPLLGRQAARCAGLAVAWLNMLPPRKPG